MNRECFKYMDIDDVLDIMITAHILNATNQLKIYRECLPILKEKILENRENE